MIILIGESGSGKSTIERLLCSKYKFNRAISHTTREIRENETANVDYFYIDKTTFEAKLADGEFAEHVEYNGNYYGLNKNYLEEDNVVAVVEPLGLRQIQEIASDKVVSVYLNVSEDTRRERMLARGDKPEDAEKRIEYDRGHFAGLSDIVDVVLEIDKEDTPDEIALRVIEQYDSLTTVTSIDKDSEDSKLPLAIKILLCFAVVVVLFVGYLGIKEYKLYSAYDTVSVKDSTNMSDDITLYYKTVYDADTPDAIDFTVQGATVDGHHKGYLLDSSYLGFYITGNESVVIYEEIVSDVYEIAYFYSAGMLYKTTNLETLEISLLPNTSSTLDEGKKYILEIPEPVSADTSLTLAERDLADKEGRSYEEVEEEKKANTPIVEKSDIKVYFSDRQSLLSYK